MHGSDVCKEMSVRSVPRSAPISAILLLAATVLKSCYYIIPLPAVELPPISLDTMVYPFTAYHIYIDKSFMGMYV